MAELTEDQRLAEGRDYFERGCLCIDNGTLQKLPESVSNLDAIEHYENSCVCSRNYVPKYGKQN